jgi:two-component system, OmpR family, sensor histidine kinase KdpD
MENRIVLGWKQVPRSLLVPAQYLAACAVLALFTWGGFVLRVNLATIVSCYLLVVVAMALFCGFWQASFTSVLAVACLDYFFTQPLFRFVISDPQDWVALAAFQITALTISRLSARELRNAREAAFHRGGIEKLYELSRSSLLLDLHEPPGPQLAVLIHRIFNTEAIALYDMNLNRQDRMGEWAEGDEDAALECYRKDAAGDDPQARTWRRILQTGSGSVGALVVRGDLNPLVVNALASLAAIAIDRQQWIEREDKAETARKGVELRGAVMDALAHELKTPLTAVQTASSGLRELGGLTNSQSDLVELIDAEAVHLNELCTRLLVTAKLEAEKVALATNDVNVQELIEEVLEGRHAGAERARMRVVVEDSALTVRVDRALLAMILTQYIDNARKYSTPGTPIEIAASSSHSEVLFSVHNFGSTIRIEDRERIFDRFYRSEDLKDTVPGTGVGLAVVRKAAEAHHGHVWVISDDKEGTTFFLSLPKGARRKH